MVAQKILRRSQERERECGRERVRGRLFCYDLDSGAQKHMTVIGIVEIMLKVTIVCVDIRFKLHIFATSHLIHAQVYALGASLFVHLQLRAK